MSEKLNKLEQEYTANKVKLEQYQHRAQRLENRVKYFEKGERQKRAHRLITRGAAVESIMPQVKAMGERQFYVLIEKVFDLPEVRAIVDVATSREDE